MKTRATKAVVTILALATSACVSKGRYDDAVADAWTTRVEMEKQRESLAKKNEQLRDLYAQNDARTKENAQLKLELWLQDKAAGADRRYASARVAELAKRLNEVERAQAEAEWQAIVYQAISLRLREQISAGDLDVVVRDGRMVLSLPNDVLFDTGRTELKRGAERTLAEVALVLSAYPGRRFQVAGYTDDVPIHTEKFPSNWELSSARALRVLHFLVAKGMSAESLSAAGYGSIDPITSNATPDGRRSNRRMEITVQPSLDGSAIPPRQ